MIYLNIGSSSVVTLTLYELSSQTLPQYYTWEMVRKGTFEEVVFYVDDAASNQYYWNSFTISVVANTASQGLTAGIVALNAGEWNYRVFEMANPYILNTASCVGLVETGLCIVTGTYSGINTYITDIAPINYYKKL